MVPTTGSPAASNDPEDAPTDLPKSREKAAKMLKYLINLIKFKSGIEDREKNMPPNYKIDEKIEGRIEATEVKPGILAKPMKIEITENGVTIVKITNELGVRVECDEIVSRNLLIFFDFFFSFEVHPEDEEDCHKIDHQDFQSLKMEETEVMRRCEHNLEGSVSIGGAVVDQDGIGWSQKRAKDEQNDQYIDIMEKYFDKNVRG